MTDDRQQIDPALALLADLAASAVRQQAPQLGEMASRLLSQQVIAATRDVQGRLAESRPTSPPDPEPEE